MSNREVSKDYTGTLATGSVELTNLGAACAAGTKEKVIEVRNQLAAGTLKVFDTTKFTVDGLQLNSYLDDVDDDGTYSHETEAITDGYFHESEYRSAPYFDMTIDGITLLDSAY